MGTKKANTTAYHPQTDGLVENIDRTIVVMIAKHAKTLILVITGTPIFLNFCLPIGPNRMNLQESLPSSFSNAGMPGYQQIQLSLNH